MTGRALSSILNISRSMRRRLPPLHGVADVICDFRDIEPTRKLPLMSGLRLGVAGEIFLK